MIERKVVDGWKLVLCLVAFESAWNWALKARNETNPSPLSESSPPVGNHSHRWNNHIIANKHLHSILLFSIHDHRRSVCLFSGGKKLMFEIWITFVNKLFIFRFPNECLSLFRQIRIIVWRSLVCIILNYSILVYWMKMFIAFFKIFFIQC